MLVFRDHRDKQRLQGIGQMVIDNFNRSRFAEVYAVLLVITTLAVVGNTLVDRIARRPGSSAQRF